MEANWLIKCAVGKHISNYKDAFTTNNIVQINFYVDAYSQMSDSNGQLIATKFEDFMRQCFILTAAVGEEPSFHYKPGLARDVFPNVGTSS